MMLEAGVKMAIDRSHANHSNVVSVTSDLVCSLHRGLLEGFVDEVGGAQVVSFNSVAHRLPCRSEIAVT